VNAKSFDFLERVARIFERTDARYGLSCGRQDNNSFGDAFVDVQVGRLDVRIRRERGELLVEVGPHGATDSAVNCLLSDDSGSALQDTDENLRAIVTWLLDYEVKRHGGK